MQATWLIGDEVTIGEGSMRGILVHARTHTGEDEIQWRVRWDDGEECWVSESLLEPWELS